MTGETLPKPLKDEGVTLDSADLAAQRYGTQETVDTLGEEKTFGYQLKAQGAAAQTLFEADPEIIPKEDALEIARSANIEAVPPERIWFHEAVTGHDIIGLNTALEEVVSPQAGAHINKARTSGDTTVTSKALQSQDALRIIVDTIENLRDITLERSMKWIDIPHMDTSHQYDALPTVVGRPFSHYAEMLQSGLNYLKVVYESSIIGKWGDATGNHHSATVLGLDGILLQENYCNKLGIGHMTAPAQVPGLEFEADILYALARVGATVDNLARYVAWGRSDDVGIFINEDPNRKKGSSAMPHKDAKNGNPVVEEQNMSVYNYLVGNLMTAMMNCRLTYARDLSGSSNSRINFEDGFKFADQAFRKMAKTLYWMGIKEDRAVERVNRSLGYPTSQQVMTYLTDRRKVKNPMTRSGAHDLMGRIATEGWDAGVPFIDALLQEPAVTHRIEESTLRKIADPVAYIGASKEIVKRVYLAYHQQSTLGQ